MAKLKFDRSVDIKLTSNSDKTTVPSNEVWKGTIIGALGSTSNEPGGRINGFEICGKVRSESAREGVHSIILGGGLFSKEGLCLQGLHLKLLANIFAKEVSLA